MPNKLANANNKVDNFQIKINNLISWIVEGFMRLCDGGSL